MNKYIFFVYFVLFSKIYQITPTPTHYQTQLITYCIIITQVAVYTPIHISNSNLITTSKTTLAFIFWFVVVIRVCSGLGLHSNHKYSLFFGLFCNHLTKEYVCALLYSFVLSLDLLTVFVISLISHTTCYART